ncbi:MAG: GNAT family N-acetyltransferase [Bacillota bacterium]
MIRIEEADYAYSELISGIIRKSFKTQADILGISEESYPNYVAFETPARVRGRMDKGSLFFLAFQGDIPVGTVSISRDRNNLKRGYISRFCVIPEYRGRDYGKLLISHAENILRASGVECIEISIVAEFTRLEEYYSRLGYIANEKKTVPSLPFLILYMEKR